jgi:hypothetical protein
MANPARGLESKVLKLSRRDRARLAQNRLSSLDQEADAEAERRLGQLQSGKVVGIPAGNVIRKARSSLR